MIGADTGLEENNLTPVAVADSIIYYHSRRNDLIENTDTQKLFEKVVSK